MADGRRNNRGQTGKANKGGSKGYGILEMVKKNLNKYQPKWWDYLGEMMEGKDNEMKRFAMTEYNKLQIKVLPTIVAGDSDSPLAVFFDNTFKKDEPSNSTPKTKGDNTK